MSHLDLIAWVGDAPYHLLEPVLQKCTAAQLKRIESYNPQLWDETHDLWKAHVKQEFKEEFGKRKKGETYKQFYERASRMREQKLKEITKRIQLKKKQEMEPVKKTLVLSSAHKAGSKRLPAATKSSATATATSAAEIRLKAKETRVAAASKPKHKSGPLFKKTMKMYRNGFMK